MALSKSPYRGTRDFFPNLKRERDWIFQHMEKSAKAYGYESYDGPLLEEVDLYLAKSGEELINDQIYSFTDRGERFVAIRPEMTPTLARMISQIHREVPKPIRWFSIPNLMRYEKPQRGRLREHWQLNCDIFGAPEGLGEAEILSLLVDVFLSLGATQKHFQLLINDRRVVDALFKNKMKLDEATIYKLYKIIDKSKKVTPEALGKMTSELNLSSENQQLFAEYLSLESFQAVVDFMKKCDQADSTTALVKFLEIAPSMNLMPYLTYDPTIVRGLDYYTGLVFEAFDLHPENKRALCGGGAYSSLLKIFNEEPVPGVGFGLGDVTLTDFLKTHQLMPDFSKPINDIFIACQEENGLHLVQSFAQELRRNNLQVVTALEPLKFKKVFNMAEKSGAHSVALMGSDEIANKTVVLKNLKTQTQETFSLDKISDCLAFILKSRG
jgi:histidyl-tRNA synthetase